MLDPVSLKLKYLNINIFPKHIWMKCYIPGTIPICSPVSFTRELVTQVIFFLFFQLTSEHVGRATGEHVDQVIFQSFTVQLLFNVRAVKTKSTFKL